MKSLRVLPLVVLPGVLFGGVHTVFPSGGDDTAAVQTAVNACTAEADCIVEFKAGVYRTRQIIGKEFRGTIRGAGANATWVEPFGRLKVTNAQQLVFTSLTSQENLFPNLWSFVDSELALRDMGFRVTAADPAEPYKNLAGWPGPDPATHLLALLWVTGSKGNLDVERCAFEGERGSFPSGLPETYNLHWGVAVWGQPGPSTFFDGGLSVRSSSFRKMSTAITTQRVRNRRYQIGGSPGAENTFEESCWTIQAYQVDNAAYEISHNHFTSGCAADAPQIWIEQQNRTLRPSTYLISKNQFHLKTGYAVSIADYIRDGVEGRLSDVLVSGNHIWAQETAGGIRVVNNSRALQPNEWTGADVVISNNIIEGSSTRRALYVEQALGVTLTNNDVGKFTTTLNAPYFIRNSFDCLISGQNGAVEFAGNGMGTHTVTGVRRFN